LSPPQPAGLAEGVARVKVAARRVRKRRVRVLVFILAALIWSRVVIDGWWWWSSNLAI
jgi:hypothetical protein